MLKHLSYVSEQSYILSEADIEQLLIQCRSKNSALGISGMLIYFDGTFTQFLEGPEAAIDGVFSKIQKDTRHHNVVLLASGFSDKRAFTDWSMAYKKLNPGEAQKILGYKRFKKEDLFTESSPGIQHPGVLLLKNFVNNLHIR